MIRSIPYLVACAFGVALAFLGESWGIALAIASLAATVVNEHLSYGAKETSKRLYVLEEKQGLLQAAHAAGAGQRLDMHAAEKAMAMELAAKLKDVQARLSQLETESGMKKTEQAIHAAMGY